MSTASVFRFKYLFKKYLDNGCSLSELEELFDLAGKEENSKELKILLEQLWLGMSHSFADEVDNEGKELRYKKLIETIEYERKTYSFERKRPQWIWWSAAASVLIIVFTAIYLFSGHYTQPGKQIKIMAAIPAKTPSYVHIVKLSDGSTVYLNKGSHLDYPARFNGKNREVYLTGEAFFDIRHDGKHPFFVYAGGVVTQVLGTAFNIKDDGNNVKVTVTRGKVSVSVRSKLLAILQPNQQISYNKASHQASQLRLIAETTILWKEPDLVMDNITLKEATAILSERYGVSVQLGDHHLDSCRFSASFLNTTQLNQVISVLSRLNNLEVEKDNDKAVVLNGPGCK